MGLQGRLGLRGRFGLRGRKNREMEVYMPRTEYQWMKGWKFAFAEEAEGGDLPKAQRFQDVTLPHDWAVGRPFSTAMDEAAPQGYRDRFGIGWYEKTWDMEEKKEGYRYYLEFGGIFEDSAIWVNGMLAGGRKYGYSTFQLDITPYIRAGSNQMTIRVDNTKRPVDRWYSGAGIYRTVKWMEVEEAHLNPWDVTVKTRLSEDGSEAEIFVDAGVDARICGQLWETGQGCGTPVLEETGRGRLRFTLSKPKLWSSEAPNLYQLVLKRIEGERVTDAIAQRIGIRSVTFDKDTGMRVNGVSEKLKGVCLHQEAGCTGTAVKKEIWRKRLEDLKEAGCNAIRAAHHTYAEEFLDLCDEMGFYVYEECFDKWKGGLYGRYFDTEWKRDVEAMVKRDRNRPSVVIWGVGNEVENQAQESMLSILEMLTGYIRSLDETRPVTYAMNPHFKRESQVDLAKIKDIQKFVDEVDDTEIYDVEEKVERIAKIAAHVDIISGNYLEALYPEIHRRIPDKPILGTEIYQFFQGTKGQLKNFSNANPSLVPFQADYVIGGMIWTGFDYLGESMGYPAKGWSGALIRTNRERRASYYIMQSYWSKTPMVHLSVMDYSLMDEGVKEMWDMPIYADHWHFPQFCKAVIPYMIASNCGQVRLFLNGDALEVPRPGDCENRVITGFVPWQPGTLEAVGYEEGREVCRHTLVTPGPAVKLEFGEVSGSDSDADALFLPAEEGYECLLTVRAKDKEGNPYFRESALVRFAVEGEADIVGVDSGNLMSSESYQETFIHMYHGCASVQIRLRGRAGRIVVRANADGLYGAAQVIVAGAGTGPL